MTYRLGVDLGTTFTTAAVLRERAAPEAFVLGERAGAVPTVLYLAPNGSVEFGEKAEELGRLCPDRVVRQFQRRVGDGVPLVVGSGAQGYVDHRAHDLAAAMIAWVVAQVAAAEGEAPDAVAVTHPATWGPHKIELLRAALTPHGVQNLTLLSEPEAAAYTYAYAGRLRSGDTVAVYDLGGGTFNAAVVHADVHGRFVLLGRPVCLPDVGGIDFDCAIFSHVLSMLDPAVRAALGGEGGAEPDEAVAEAAAGLRQSSAAAKETLSVEPEASVSVACGETDSGVLLTRARFEALIESSLVPTLGALDRSLASAGIQARDLTCVLLAGGSSRMPLITRMLSAHLGPDVEICRDIDPKMIVAAGAALAIIALGPEARAAAVHTEPWPVAGLAEARGGAGKAGRVTAPAGRPIRTAKTPPPMEISPQEAPLGKVARLMEGATRALPPSKGALAPAQAARPGPQTPMTAASPPLEPGGIRGATATEAGRGALERGGTPRAGRESAAAMVNEGAGVAFAEVAALLSAEESYDADRPVGSVPWAKEGDRGKPVRPPRRRQTRTCPTAEHVQPRPLRLSPVACEPVAGRPILPRREHNRAEVVGLEVASGPAHARGTRPAEEEPPAPVAGRVVVPPRSVRGLAELLGPQPGPAAQAETGRPAAARAGDHRAEREDRLGGRASPAAGSSAKLPRRRDPGHGRRRRPRPEPPALAHGLTARGIFTTRRALALCALTAALFVGSGAWSTATSPTEEVKTSTVTHHKRAGG